MKAKYSLKIVLIVLTCVCVILFFMKTCELTDGQGSPQGTPSPGFIPEVVSPAVEDDFEDTSSAIVGAGNYQNNKTFTVTALNGKTISAGVKNTEANDAIYLNLDYEKAAAGSETGYYISADRGLLKYSGIGKEQDCDSGTNADYNNFYILERCWDQVVPITYKNNEEFGLMWQDDFLSDGTSAGATISVRAVNVKSKEFLGVFKLVITRNDEGKYAIASFTSDDVSVTGELAPEERELAVSQAIRFATEKILVEPDEKWEKAALEKAVVDKINHAYFPRFLNERTLTAKISEFRSCKDTFAVTIPVKGNGYLTVYFAPKLELIGLDQSALQGTETLDLQIYGYDPVLVFSQAALEQVVPSDFITD